MLKDIDHEALKPAAWRIDALQVMQSVTAPYVCARPCVFRDAVILKRCPRQPLTRPLPVVTACCKQLTRRCG